MMNLKIMIKNRKWKSFTYQILNSATSIEDIEKILDIRFPDDEKEKIRLCINRFPMRITPYYLSLIDRDNYITDPIYKQCVPDIRELDNYINEQEDPLLEEKYSPVKNLIHRYPDRVLFLVSNVCATYCRHCTRKRKVGNCNKFEMKTSIYEKAIKYISNHKEIRDVILSGGDPLLLSIDKIENLLKELRKIKHIEIIRIGTRVPVTLPYRITDELVKVIKKYGPIWINTQYNHPNELSDISIKYISKFIDNGIPVNNQSVLLSGINDNIEVMRELLNKLVYNRIRPYYLYQCDLSEGLSHFRTTIKDGLNLMEKLIGYTTGFSIPTFIIDSPNGMGKIPILPNYIKNIDEEVIELVNFEGKLIKINYKKEIRLN